MPKGREELRRGVRRLIEVTSREMGALEGDPNPPGADPEATPEAVSEERPDRPILRLVREPRPVATIPVAEPSQSVPDAAVPAPAAAPTPVAPPPGPVVPASRSAPAPIVAPVRSRPEIAGEESLTTGAPTLVAPVYGIPADASGVHPRKGVCAAYYVSQACWEVPDAYCNQALHVCMLRECPVYTLNREELERRFASKFKHLW